MSHGRDIGEYLSVTIYLRMVIESSAPDNRDARGSQVGQGMRRTSHDHPDCSDAG